MYYRGRISTTMTQNKLKIITICLICAGTLLAIIAFVFLKLTPLQRYYLVNNPVGRHFMPTWHAIKKLPNLIHLPYWFTKSHLETYALEISFTNLQRLNDNLPIDPNTYRAGRLTEEYKYFVNAVFKSDDYNGDVEIRYRGLCSNNWNAEKKAIMIKFPSDNLFRGMKSLNFFLPDDRAYFIEPLNAYRAKKLGLYAPDFWFARLNINGKDAGVYLAAEHWSKSWLEKNNLYSIDNIFSIKDQNFDSRESIFSENRINDWKSYTAENEDGPFEELKTLIRLIEKADEKEFAEKIGQLVELEKFYKWQVVNTLAGSTHQSDTNNVVLLFKKETGKFEPIPWDVGIKAISDDFYTLGNTLIQRILNNQEFFREYNAILKNYAADEQNLVDDLNYYDHLYQSLQKEFYKDQAKIHNDFVFDRQVKKYRELIISNFQAAKKLAEIEKYPSAPRISEDAKQTKELWFEGSFKFFDDATKSADEFLSQHPQFYKKDKNTLVLKKGTHIFHNTVIIPTGLRLVIEPGAHLYFAPRVSLISVSYTHLTLPTN